MLLLILLAACTASTRPSSSRATSFADGVCASISTWSKDLVEAANTFTDLSPHLSVEGRRAQYLFAFDNQVRITDELRDQLEAAPSTGVDDAGALRDQLVQATDSVVANIRDDQADAASNVEFDTVGPKPDRLFAGTEKNLSLVLKPLDALARDRHVDALGGTCGR